MKPRTVYIYLNTKSYDGTVFNTQVANWLELYNENGITFEYWHVFSVQYLKNRNYIKSQLDGIRSTKTNLKGYTWAFPSRGIMAKINAHLWYQKLKPYQKNYDKIVIFSRCLFGKEIAYLKKWFKIPVVFIYDGRAASAEENRYSLIKSNDFSKKRFDTLSHVLFTEAVTLSIADKTFTVSNALKQYFRKNFNVDSSKMFIYPCLSDPKKFFFSETVRSEIRNQLGYNADSLVFMYSGGAGKYHATDVILKFFKQLQKQNKNARLLILTKDIDIIKNEIEEILADSTDFVIFMSVNNNEIFKYLNAADYGILFRENMPINNVASPSKYAEYMLTGLPVIISEGIGDYSEYTVKNNVGHLIPEHNLSDWNDFNFSIFDKYPYNRTEIAKSALKDFSKESLLPKVIEQFNSI